MEPINLEKLKEGYRGKPFRKLVEYHLRRQSQDTRIQGLRGTIELLPEPARPLVEDFIDRWNIKAYNKQFWETDTSLVFSELINDARYSLAKSGAPIDDETLFNMFNIVVMNYAYSAHEQPKMREFISVSSVFPFASLLALIYPIGATVHISINTPASLPTIVGYGVANLGYLLIVAGIVSGTFLVFGLKKRTHVFVAGAVALLIGFIFSNISTWGT